MQFEEFALHAQIMAGVRSAGYTTPTPIQAQAIPAVLSGQDLIGLAQTGTGKTAAFVLPILHRMLEAKARQEGPVRTLILAPTRELALQIHHDVMKLGRKTYYRSAPVIGGVGQFGQVKALRKAAICVACPGRLLDLMQQGVADMSHVDTLILDEADTMLDMGFMPAIKQILARLPKATTKNGQPARQTLLFSATMPAQIRSLAEALMHEPHTVQVANTAPSGSVAHSVYPVSQDDKGAALEAMLHGAEDGSVIVFTRTKHRAKSLAVKLSKRGLAAVALQGNMSQNQRQAAMDGFKKGRHRILVATDIAARGIDCQSVSHVINYDPPDTAEAYTHRIGRTGRANRTGVAVTLMTPGERRLMKDIERALGCQIDRYVDADGSEVTACIPSEPLVLEERPGRRDDRFDQGRRHTGEAHRAGNRGHHRRPQRAAEGAQEADRHGAQRTQAGGQGDGAAHGKPRHPNANRPGGQRKRSGRPHGQQRPQQQGQRQRREGAPA